MAVGVCYQLIGFFACGIQAERMVHIMVHRERHGSVGAIHTGTAGIHQMFNAIVTASFKDVCKADDVAIDVRQWVVNGIANTGLRGKVHHALWLVRFKGVLYGLAIGKVDAQMGVPGVLGVTRQASIFKGRVVIVVVVVYANDCVAARQEPEYKGRPNKTSGTGDKDFHSIISEQVAAIDFV